MNALKYKYQQGIQELIQDGMPASEITCNSQDLF